MTTAVRVSPLGIFCFVCGGFIVLYTLKNVLFVNQYTYQHINEKIQVKRLLETSIYLAEKGGEALKDIREKSELKARSKGVTLEGVVDPLTEGDMESHKTIVHGFYHLFPFVTVVSEEHDHGDKENLPIDIKTSDILNISNDLHNNEDQLVLSDDVVIWVDPLDATKEYTENLVKYVTTMVCIVVKGVPVAGVIHQPFLKKTFWAWANHGHSKDLSKPLLHDASLANPRIIVSRSHAGSVNETAKSAFGKDVKIIPAGGAGFKVLSLFNNTADAYVHKTLIKRWDICAGDALLRSFGGKMTTLHGAEITYGEKNVVRNSGGLLATLNNHARFLEKLSGLTTPITALQKE